MDDYYTDISRLFSRLIAALCTFSNCNLIFSTTRPFLLIKIEQAILKTRLQHLFSPPRVRLRRHSINDLGQCLNKFYDYSGIVWISNKIHALLRAINSILRILFAYYFQSLIIEHRRC